MMDMVTKKQIYDKLSEVIDPELGVNIVDLGLIYEVKVKEKNAYIKMTFTTPACPLINVMLAQVEQKLNEIENADIEVSIVFDPPWTPEKMSDKARLALGIE